MPGGREGDHSAADVERLRDAYRALGESGVSALAHVLGDELRWLAPSSVMPTTLSRDDLLARLVDLGWDRLHFEPNDFAVSGRRIVATVRETRKDRGGLLHRPPRPLLGDGQRRRRAARGVRVADRRARRGHGDFAFLEDLHQWVRPSIYAEIGVYTGRSLARARPGTRIVGIIEAADRGPRRGGCRSHLHADQRRVLQHPRPAGGAGRVTGRPLLHRRPAPVRVRAARLHQPGARRARSSR